MAFGDLHEPFSLENLEAPVQISICEPAELLQVDEGDAGSIRNKRGEYTEVSAFVDDAIQASVGERGRPAVLRYASLEGSCGLKRGCRYQELADRE